MPTKTAAQPATERYRVVYGETRPVWEAAFPTLQEARAFAKEHRSFGDVVFSVHKIGPDEPMRGALAKLKAES